LPSFLRYGIIKKQATPYHLQKERSNKRQWRTTFSIPL